MTLTVRRRSFRTSFFTMDTISSVITKGGSSSRPLSLLWIQYLQLLQKVGALHDLYLYYGYNIFSYYKRWELFTTFIFTMDTISSVIRALHDLYLYYGYNIFSYYKRWELFTTFIFTMDTISSVITKVGSSSRPLSLLGIQYLQLLQKMGALHDLYLY